MKLEKYLKKIIIVIGLILLLVVLYNNLLFTSSVSNDLVEKVTITYNNIFKLVISIILAVFMYYISIKLQRIDNKKTKRIVLIGILIAFYIIQIIWIIYRKASPVADQAYAYGGASSLYNSNMSELDAKYYFAQYPHQLNLVFLWDLLFNIIRINSTVIIKLLNAFANTLSLFAIYLITDYLGKKEKKSNNPLAIILFCGLVVIPMLSNFVYGDEVGITLALFSVYFIMKYSLEEKRKYLIYSAILMSLGCMVRMNNLIVVIAILIYLLLDILKQKYDFVKKDILKISYKILFIILFTIISFTPSYLVKNIMINKYNLNTDLEFPVIGYLAMGLSESRREAGWYNEDLYNMNFLGKEQKNNAYKQVIKNRLENFKNNPKELIDFYTRKIISTWTENSYSAIWYNLTFNFSDKKTEVDLKKDEQVLSTDNAIRIIQKGVVLLIFTSSLIFIFKNKNNLSNEIILLLLIFIGGFLFHILWETKSRYIIPYLIILIPIASMNTKLRKISLKNLKKKSDKTKNENCKK